VLNSGMYGEMSTDSSAEMFTARLSTDPARALLINNEAYKSQVYKN